jgi:hypothetical protein
VPVFIQFTVPFTPNFIGLWLHLFYHKCTLETPGAITFMSVPRMFASRVVASCALYSPQLELATHGTVCDTWAWPITGLGHLQGFASRKLLSACYAKDFAWQVSYPVPCPMNICATMWSKVTVGAHYWNNGLIVHYCSRDFATHTVTMILDTILAFVIFLVALLMSWPVIVAWRTPLGI